MTQFQSVSPETSSWFYADAQNQPVGPVSHEALKQLAAAGTILPATQVIREGTTEWRAFSEAFPATGPQPPSLPASTPPTKKHRKWVPVVGLFFLYPLGLLLLWRCNAFRVRTKAILAACFLPWFLAMLFAPRSPESSTGSAPQAARAASTAAVPTEQLPSTKARVEGLMKEVFGRDFRRITMNAQPGGKYFVEVDFNIRDNFTTAMVKKGAEMKMEAAYQKLFTTPHLNVRSVVLTGYQKLTDKYGKESEDRTYRTEMDDETAAKVVWENAGRLDFTQIWHTSFLHRAFSE